MLIKKNPPRESSFRKFLEKLLTDLAKVRGELEAILGKGARREGRFTSSSSCAHSDLPMITDTAIVQLSFIACSETDNGS